MNIFKIILNYLPGTIGPALFSVVFIKFATINLDAETLGKINYWINIGAIIISFSVQWINLSIFKFYSDKKILYQKEATLILASISCLILVPFVLFFLKKEIPMFQISFYVYLILNILIQLILTKNQVQFNSKKYSIIKLMDSMLKFSIPVIIIIFISKNASIILLGYLISSVIVVFIFYKTLLFKNSFSKDIIIKKFKETLKVYGTYGLPMFVWFGTNSLIGFVDKYFLKNYRGFKELGEYSINYNLVLGSVALVFTPLMVVAHPYLIKSWNDNISTAKLKLTFFIELFIFIAYIVLFFVLVNRELITIIFLSEDYIKSSILIPLLSLNFILWQLGMYVHKPAEYISDTKSMVISISLALIANISFCYLLIPIYSYYGAVIANFFSAILYIILMKIFTRNIIKYKMYNISLFKEFIFILVTCILIEFFIVSNILKFLLSLIIIFTFLIIKYKKIIVGFKNLNNGGKYVSKN